MIASSMKLTLSMFLKTFHCDDIYGINVAQASRIFKHFFHAIDFFMATLKLIRVNSTGPEVGTWQYFLRGRGFYLGEVTGKFDEETLRATIDFQRRHNLQPDGIVGNKTYGMAMQLGYEGIEDDSTEKTSMNWPGEPSFPPLISNEQRRKVFGTFTFVSEPVNGNPENIRITGGWQAKNIEMLDIPQLVKVKGNGRAQFHKLAAGQLMKLWSDWEEADLLHLVLAWDGSFVPRFVRGSRKTLSNHAFGSAFDINASWNGLGVTPPLVGQKGSVRELVEIAFENGFYWGGHFSRKDGMHFEIAKIL